MNKAMIIGQLGADPKITQSRNGTIANFSVATNETYRDKNGQTQSITDWHDISIFGKYAEVAGKYLKKGSKVFIEGKMKKSRYEDKDGITRYSFSIVAQNFEMLGDSKKADNPQSAYQQPQQQTPAQAPQRTIQQQQMADDDIPF